MVIQFPYLEEYQRDLLKCYDENKHAKRIIVKSPRQCGKSTALVLLLLYASYQEENSVSILVSPIAAQSRKIYDDFTRIAADLVWKSNASIMEITLSNGSRVLFKSAESGDNLRGQTVKKSGILAIDEAAYINEDLFYEVLLPMTNVFQSTIVFTSTPKFQEGLFYKMWNAGLDPDDNSTISFDWTKYDLSKYLPQNLLDIYRKQMPSNAFRSEYLAEFITGEGSVFSNYRNCVLTAITDAKQEVIISVDWSAQVKGDDTVITFMQYLDKKIQVQKQLAFNDANANETIEIILSQVKRLFREGYRNITIVVESNSIGEVYFQLLHDKLDDLEMEYLRTISEEFDLNLRKLYTTQKSKDRQVKQLENLFEQQKIVIPNDDKLMLQLTSYECHVSPNGNLSYGNSSPTIHDDMVMSLMIGVDSIYNLTLDN